MLKQEFQRAMLLRIPAIQSHPEKHWREVLFLCDEDQYLQRRVRAIQPAMRDSLHYHAKLAALPSWPRRASVRCDQHCQGSPGALCSRLSARRFS
jgi:hypothetical protein